MRLLIKELEPTTGTILVAGRDLAEITRKKVPYYRRNLGVVFQDFKLLPNRTVHDNVAYALQVTGSSRKEIRAKVPDILRLTGLSTKLHHYPDQLSGGEQQRVSIARAFVNHPPLLLADEPTGNLDPETSIGIMQLLYRINRTGTTVLVATHDNGDGRPHAPPRDRARRGPHRPRRDRRAATRRRDMTHRRVRRAAARAGARAAPRVARAGRRLRRRLPRLMKRRLLPARGAALACRATPSRASRRMASVLVTLLVLGVFIPVVQATTGAANEVRGRVLVNVYLKTERHAGGHRARAAPARRQRRPRREGRSSSRKAQALQRARRRKNPEAYELLGSNPLPDTFRVTPDRTRTTRSKLVDALAPHDARRRRARRSTRRSTTVKNSQGRHAEDPLATQRREAHDRPAGGAARDRVDPADLQHDPPVALLAPARGRGDEARRRDRLVHPLAVRASRASSSARSAALLAVLLLRRGEDRAASTRSSSRLRAARRAADTIDFGAARRRPAGRRRSACQRARLGTLAAPLPAASEPRGERHVACRTL